MRFDELQCGVENFRSNYISLYDSRLDNVYAINLDHISHMHLSYLKASIDDALLWYCRKVMQASMNTLHKLVKHDFRKRIVTPYLLTTMIMLS